MCPSSWHLGTSKECTEHGDAHHTHPIPTKSPTASHVQLIPTPEQGTLAHPSSSCAPAPREDPDTRISHSRPPDLLVQAHSLPRDMPFLCGAVSGPLWPALLWRAPTAGNCIPCERVLVRLFSRAQLVCQLFSTAFPLESHSSVSGFCPGRLLALGYCKANKEQR